MINKVILVGNVGKDPEIRMFNEGNKIANFSLATSKKYTKDGEKLSFTEWHNISVRYNKLADVIEMFVKKGMLLYVEGEIRTRDYEDKDGNKRYITEIVANTIQMLSGSKSEENQVNETEEDDLPL